MNYFDEVYEETLFIYGANVGLHNYMFLQPSQRNASEPA